VRLSEISAQLADLTETQHQLRTVVEELFDACKNAASAEFGLHPPLDMELRPDDDDSTQPTPLVWPGADQQATPAADTMPTVVQLP
jgi:hypothetical protein